MICTPFTGQTSKGGILMSFSYEFKMACVKALKQGVYLDTPEGISKASFKSLVRKWRRLEELHGPEAFMHNKSRLQWTTDQKMALIARVFSGESVNSVAESVCIHSSTLHRWVRQYNAEGYNELVTNRFKMTSKENSMKKVTNQTPLSDSEREELLRLREEVAYFKAENAVIKKEIALREKKQAALLKAKKQRSSKNSAKKDSN